MDCSGQVSDVTGNSLGNWSRGMLLFSVYGLAITTPLAIGYLRCDLRIYEFTEIS